MGHYPALRKVVREHETMSPSDIAKPHVPKSTPNYKTERKIANGEM